MKTELERYKTAMDVVFSELMARGLDEAHFTEQLGSKVELILNPPPEMETVEVVVYKCQCCNSLYDDPGMYHGKELIKLTGTHQRPKPQKVERSVSAEAYITPDGEVKLSTKDGYTNYPIFKDREEVRYKSGTLTFTWTE